MLCAFSVPLWETSRNPLFLLPMKVSNETKVGILTILALTILILGFNFLKGKDVLTKRKKI